MAKNQESIIELKPIIRQHCPACNRYVKVSSRYPNYACIKCQQLAVDGNGRKVEFYNTTQDGHGCEGIILETNQILDLNTCFIKGIKFTVDEAYMGGVVYIPIPKRKRKVSSKQP